MSGSFPSPHFPRCKNCGANMSSHAMSKPGQPHMLTAAKCPGYEAEESTMPDHEASSVNHPAHYGGGDNPYEAIKVIEAWGLGFCLGNAVKYVSRAGKKDPSKLVEDLEKARWYLDREIKRLRNP